MIYGYRTKLKMGRFLGYRICGNCQKVNTFFLARVVFVVHICFIPIFWFTKKRYLLCNVCQSGFELSKKDYKITEEKFKNFSSPDECLEHYRYIKELCRGLDYSQYNETTVYQNLCRKYSIEEFEDYYMMIIRDVLQYTNNSMENNN